MNPSCEFPHSKDGGYWDFCQEIFNFFLRKLMSVSCMKQSQMLKFKQENLQLDRVMI